MTYLRRTAALAAALTVLPFTLIAPAGADPTDATAVTATGAASSVVINEVESNGDPDGDWVELANTDPDNSVDVSGWGIIDNDASHDPLVLPAGTEIESGGYLVVFTEESFGLGGDDAVTLADSSGATIDETSWSGHAATTWGRIPDGTGEFAVTGEPTRGLGNVAKNDGGDSDTDPSTAPWPYDPLDVAPVALTGDYAEDFAGEDMSGIDAGPDGTVYVVNNDAGTLYVLSPESTDGSDADSYHVDARHQLRYTDGTGLPDAEGVTVGPDGALFVATERDNSEGKDDTSRPSVLRFDLAGVDTADGDLVATDEWNLADITGELGANGGLETISWISGDDRPALFAVGVEESGEVLFVSLDGAEPTLVQRYDSPFEGVMASDYDAASGELTILCDEVCDGASQVLVPLAGSASGAASVSGSGSGDAVFGPRDDAVYARPAGMDNYADEGYARYVSADGVEHFLWADDGATDGTGLRGAVRGAGGDNDDSDDSGSGGSGSLGSTAGSASVGSTA